MSETQEDSDDWDEFADEFKNDTTKRAPWKKPKKPYEDDTTRATEEEEEKGFGTVKSISKTWQSLLKRLSELDVEKHLNLIEKIVTALGAVLESSEKAEKYPHEYPEKYPYEKKTASELIAKGLEKLTLEEIRACPNLPPEFLSARIAKAQSYSPNAEEFVSLIKKGYAPNQIPSDLLRRMTAFDFQEAEKLLKEATITQGEQGYKHGDLHKMTWQGTHKLAKKAGAP
jgi:hypothetical protein